MAAYDYLVLALARGAAARAAFVKRLGEAGTREAGRAAGLFTAQLGWPAAQVALLVERDGDALGIVDALTALAKAPEVVSSASYELRPTIRPRPADKLMAGGIYVHRWFEVVAADFDEFVVLSTESLWPEFREGRVRRAREIFGLFELTSDWPDGAPGSRHLLLVTRYGSHGVWEDSRDPTTAAMQTFARRAMLTLSTTAASTLLVAETAHG